jgi:hypothetical protein
MKKSSMAILVLIAAMVLAPGILLFGAVLGWLATYRDPRLNGS